MDTVHTIRAVRERLKPGGCLEPVVLVPTMGSLHAGHLSLMEIARRRAGPDGTVVASIFVNPTQFGPNEDYANYPRVLEDDAAKCERLGVDVIFAPDAGEIYAGDASTAVIESRLARHLCGQSRPGHFEGVCTVVSKLFNIVRPVAAVFGMKDYQQIAIIRRFVRDLNFDVEIIGGETVREPDGLALSSRNAYLTEEMRAQAPSIHQALQSCANAVSQGERDAATIEALFRETMARGAPAGRIDYATVVDANDLQPVKRIEDSAVLAVAVFFGRSRLIDNIQLTLEPPSGHDP